MILAIRPYKNPAKRAAQYVQELRQGMDVYGYRLRRAEKAFRAGYLQARRDSAVAYNLKTGRKKPEDYGIKPYKGKK